MNYSIIDYVLVIVTHPILRKTVQTKKMFEVMAHIDGFKVNRQTKSKALVF